MPTMAGFLFLRLLRLLSEIERFVTLAGVRAMLAMAARQTSCRAGWPNTTHRLQEQPARHDKRQEHCYKLQTSGE